MKAKYFIQILVTVFIYSSCIGDKVNTNLTVKNLTNNYVVYNFFSDSLKGNSFVFEIIKRSSIDKLKEYNVFPIKPMGEDYIQSMGDWNARVKSDSSIHYLYLINLNIIDSLKRNNVDSLTIKSKATTLIKATYKDLQKKKWTVTYQ